MDANCLHRDSEWQGSPWKLSGLMTVGEQPKDICHRGTEKDPGAGEGQDGSHPGRTLPGLHTGPATQGQDSSLGHTPSSLMVSASGRLPSFDSPKFYQQKHGCCVKHVCWLFSLSVVLLFFIIIYLFGPRVYLCEDVESWSYRQL